MDDATINTTLARAMGWRTVVDVTKYRPVMWLDTRTSRLRNSCPDYLTDPGASAELEDWLWKEGNFIDVSTLASDWVSLEIMPKDMDVCGENLDLSLGFSAARRRALALAAVSMLASRPAAETRGGRCGIVCAAGRRGGVSKMIEAKPPPYADNDPRIPLARIYCEINCSRWSKELGERPYAVGGDSPAQRAVVVKVRHETHVEILDKITSTIGRRIVSWYWNCRSGATGEFAMTDEGWLAWWNKENPEDTSR